MATRKTFVKDEKPKVEDMLFSDYMLEWLEMTKHSIATITYSSYSNMVKTIITPYFRELGIKLVDIKARDIQTFYTEQLKRVKANTVIHYHL